VADAPTHKLQLIRMVGHSHIRRQIRLLTARVIAAERAAGMNSDDTAKAEHLMERHVRDRREAVEGKAPDHLVFAFQLGPAHPVARCRRLPRRTENAEYVEVSRFTPALWVAKRSRPLRKDPRAILGTRIEWMLYGVNLHGSGPMSENKLGSRYRSDALRSTGGHDGIGLTLRPLCLYRMLDFCLPCFKRSQLLSAFGNLLVDGTQYGLRLLARRMF
jgi:hypothetical protein